MNPQSQAAAETNFPNDAELMRWQLRVAQRADELRRAAASPEDDREMWLRAEVEVLAGFEAAGRH